MSLLPFILYTLFAFSVNVTAAASQASSILSTSNSSYHTNSTSLYYSTLSRASNSQIYGASSASPSSPIEASGSSGAVNGIPLSTPSRNSSRESPLSVVTPSAITSNAATTSTASKAPFPITASPLYPSKSLGVLNSAGLPITSGSSNTSNASMNVPYIEFGCTPISTDPWHDAASCSCQSEVYSWYATQSTGELTTTVCYTSGQHAYGYYYSPGCSPTTETLLATSWTAPDRCCGYCNIAVPTVRIVYWAPPATVASNYSTKAANYTLLTASTVVENGFTFTSPSVYVIYSGATASASCVAMTETYHQVGGVHTTTMAYNSADLSSVACPNGLGSGGGSPVKWAPINYADLYAPIPASESLSRVSKCFTDPSQNAEWGNYMQNPFISLPQDISSADPLWSTCSAFILGAMDPPRVLTAAVSMVPVGAGRPNTNPGEPEKATPPAANPTQTAVPGQPIPIPAPSPTAPIGGDSPTKPGSIGPVNGNQSPSDPAHVGPQRGAPAPGALQGASALGPQDPPGTSPTPSTVASDPNTESNQPHFQFGPGPQNANPNDMSPTQLSVLHQALAPAPNPTVANIVNSPGAGQGGGNAPGDPQPAPKPATAPNGPSPDIQLQPISSAIFNNPQPSSKGPQNPNPGSVVPGNSAPNNGAPDNGAPGNGAPGNGAPGNGAYGNGPSGNGASQESNAPSKNNIPQGGQSGSPIQFAGLASPAPASQGVPAGYTEPATLRKGPNGGLIIGTSTITPGQVATINNHQVSVGSSNVIVDSNTYAFAPPATPPPSLVTVAGLSLQSASNGGVVMAGQTLAPGVQTTISGHVVSVGSGNVVVDGNTQILSTTTPASAPQIFVGGSAMQRASNGAVIIGSSTLAVGSQTTMDGHVISVGTANVVLDGTTNALPTPAPTGSPILINDQTMQRASNGGLILGSSTLAPGTQTTIAGHVISVGPNSVIMDSSTYALAPTAGATLISPTSAGAQRNPITLPNGAVLSAGSGPVTISGEVISILSNDQGAIIDGSTILFASSTVQSVYTVGGQTFTAAPTAFAVGGTTVSLNGPPVTIAGTVISLGPSGLQIGSSTVPLATASPTGLGGFIMSAFDAPATTSTGSASNGTGAIGVEPYTGAGAKSMYDRWVIGETLILCTAIGAVAFFM